MSYVFENRKYYSLIQLGLFMVIVFLVSQNLIFAQSNKPDERHKPPDPTKHHEIKDDDYVPVSRENQGRSPAYNYSMSNITTVQVNVDGNGQNIVGDAANEPSIAIDPNNRNKIAIGWRQFNTVTSNFRQAGYGFTINGGQTWTFPGVIEPGIFRSDPVLDCDIEGNFYYNSLTNDPDYYCKVFKSSNGGSSWNSGTPAHGGDKQWMTIDKTDSPGIGHIYAFWTSYYSTCYPGFFTRSINGGGSFENCVTIPDEPYWGTLMVGSNGNLFVGGTSGSTYDFVVARSTNAQISGQTVTWDLYTIVSLDGSITYGIGPNPGGLGGQTSLVVDTSNSAYQGNIYLLCTVERNSNPDPADVMFARSTNGGVNWSSPVRVNDDISTSAYQWFGTMSVAPTGRIDVVWLDTRDHPGSYLSALYYSYSVDGGMTWSQNERLSDFFDPHVGWPQQNKMGDYYHMVSDNNGASLAWAATFNGEQDVYYSYITPTLSNLTFQLSVNVTDGWNIVSIPGLHPTDQNISTWWAYKDPAANVFKYAGGYQAVTTATPGTGYWMKHTGARTYNTGEEWPAGGINIVPHDPIQGTSGWNLFGGYELSVTAANVTTNPPGLQNGPIYKYSSGYQVATTLDPGYGYWMKLTGVGQIIIPETLAKDGKSVKYFPENWCKIILIDATGINYTLYAVKGEVNLDQYELPPAPPSGMFDIRYSSGRIAEDLSNILKTKTIEMSGVTYPLSVRVEGMDIRLMDETGKTVNVNLKSGEDVVISDVTIQKLMVSGEFIPAEYALEQNYPNPFNPSTVIEFSLPEDVSNVKLSIYNTLGEKVAELVNTALTTGKYQYQWNAQNVVTGMYIYELRTEKFISVKKMILIK
jgi:hypothetical protein